MFGLRKSIEMFFYAGEYGKQCDKNCDAIRRQVDGSDDPKVINAAVDKGNQAMAAWVDSWFNGG